MNIKRGVAVWYAKNEDKDMPKELAVFIGEDIWGNPVVQTIERLCVTSWARVSLVLKPEEDSNG